MDRISFGNELQCISLLTFKSDGNLLLTSHNSKAFPAEPIMNEQHGQLNGLPELAALLIDVHIQLDQLHTTLVKAIDLLPHDDRERWVRINSLHSLYGSLENLSEHIKYIREHRLKCVLNLSNPLTKSKSEKIKDYIWMLGQFDINMENYTIWLVQKALEDGGQFSDFANSNEAYKAVEEVDHKIEKMKSAIN